MIDRLRSKSVPVRLKAISESESRADSDVRAELLRIFDDEHEPAIVRGCAGLALGHVHDPRLVPHTIKFLPNSILGAGKADPAHNLTPFMLGKALAAYGPESLPPLSALLKDPHKEVVSWTIAQHGAYRHNDAALDILSRYLDDREPLFRRAAAYGLAQSFHRRAEPLVLRHLCDPDPEVRYHLAWAMSNFGSPQAISSLQAQLAKDKEQQVKDELAKAIADIKARPFQPQAPPQQTNTSRKPKTR